MRFETLLDLTPIAASAGRFVAVERPVNAGLMPPLHAHEADEAVRVVEGSITVYVGSEVARLQAGDELVVRAGAAHTFRAEAEARAVFATHTRSAGSYEDFLRATAPVAVDGSGAASWATDEDAGTVIAVAAAAGVRVEGPPGELPTSAESGTRAA